MFMLKHVLICGQDLSKAGIIVIY